MIPVQKKILLLSLGNDILGDDGVGLAAARILKKGSGSEVDIVEASGLGLDLLDIVEGYNRTLILDAVSTGLHPPGTLLEFSPKDFPEAIAPSPHYAGLPELMKFAGQLGLPFPQDIKILAVEVEEQYQIREGLSPSVEKALPALVDRARNVLDNWTNEGTCTNTL